MLPPEPIPVLLVGNGEYAALAAVRALRAAGYAPWVAVEEPRAYAARSRAKAGTVLVPDPRLDGEGFVHGVAAAAARLSAAAVLPAAEPYLLALAGRKADFPEAALGAPSPEIAERATDKSLLPKLAASAGLQTPSTKVVCGDSEDIGTFGFPVIVKPLHSAFQNSDRTVSRYSARYCVSAEQVKEALETLPGGEGVIQPYIPGQLLSVVGVSWEGKLFCAVHQASIRIWSVPVGVSTYAETIPPNAEIEQGVSRLLQAIGWNGIFQAQFIRSSRGEYYLIDLNPRIYGSLALAVAAGLNLPGIWVDLLLGRQPQVCGYRVGARFRHIENDARALIWMLRNGEYRRALRGAVPRRNVTHAIFSLRDLAPLLTSLERDFRALCGCASGIQKKNALPRVSARPRRSPRALREATGKRGKG